MKETNETDLTELRDYAKSIGMTPEEYILNLHEKNQAAKSVLLENGPEFKSFVSEFHEILDELTRYRETEASKVSAEHHELIKHVTDIFSVMSRHPVLLNQLYQQYPEGIKHRNEELNQWIS